MDDLVTPCSVLADQCSHLGNQHGVSKLHGIRVPSLAISLSSRPFGTCFNQPTIHPLGLKASVAHDDCKRHRCGHRIKNLLKTVDVKGSQYPPLRRALCFRKHKLHLVTRIVNIHTLAFMCAGVPTFSNLLYTVFYSHYLNSFAPARSRCRNSKQQYQPHPGISFKIAAITINVTRFRNTQVLHKIGTNISLAQPGYRLLCRRTKSVAPPQY